MVTFNPRPFFENGLDMILHEAKWRPCSATISAITFIMAEAIVEQKLLWSHGRGHSPPGWIRSVIKSGYRGRYTLMNESKRA